MCPLYRVWTKRERILFSLSIITRGHLVTVSLSSVNTFNGRKSQFFQIWKLLQTFRSWRYFVDFTKYLSNGHEDSPQKINYWIKQKPTTLYFNSKYKHYYYVWHLNNKHDTRNHILIEYLYVNFVGSNRPPSLEYEWISLYYRIYSNLQTSRLIKYIESMPLLNPFLPEIGT